MLLPSSLRVNLAVPGEAASNINSNLYHVPVLNAEEVVPT